MQAADQVKTYIETVCEQIRWKKIHYSVAAELSAHISDQRDAYQSEGMDETAATQKAIAQMGDAVLIGQAFDKTHRPKPQWALILMAALLMMTGIFLRNLMLQQDSVLPGHRDEIIFVIIAAGLLLITYFLDFSVFGRHPLAFYFGLFFLSIVALLNSNPTYGNTRFVSILSFQVMLSYISLIFPLGFSMLIYAMRGRGVRGILLCGAGFLPYALFLMSTSSFSGFLLFTLAALLLLCTAIIKGWFQLPKRVGLALVLTPTLLSVLGACFYIMTGTGYRAARAQAMFNPFASPDGAGYLGVTVRQLIADAGFTAKTAVTGESGLLPLMEPYAATDFILTNVIHRFGWLPFFLLAGLFLVFTGLALAYVLKQKSMLGLLVSLACALTILLQTLSYIAANLSFPMLAPLSLPFISYSNTALLLNAALTGFMLSAFRTGEAVTDEAAGLIKQRSPFVSFADGQLVIRFKDSTPK